MESEEGVLLLEPLMCFPRPWVREGSVSSQMNLQVCTES